MILIIDQVASPEPLETLDITEIVEILQISPNTYKPN